MTDERIYELGWRDFGGRSKSHYFPGLVSSACGRWHKFKKTPVIPFEYLSIGFDSPLLCRECVAWINARGGGNE